MRPEDLIGKQLGRYTITRILGQGGMATVFAADDTVLRRPVALKVLYGQFLGDAALVERFRREAIIAARLEHPNIVPIYDVGEDQGIVYIAMKLLSGRSLQDELLALPGEMPPEQVLAIGTQVAAALDYAHGRGVIHRDIKPGNVMLGDDGRAILSDFGIAKSLDAPGMTTTGVIIGTPDYMSPEQIDAKQGPLDGRSDIYSLAVMIYRMLTGQRPFDGSTTDVLIAHLTRLPPLASECNPYLPPSIDRVLAQAMSKNPADRTSSAGAFMRSLRDALGDPTVVGEATPPPGALRRGGDATVIPAVAVDALAAPARQSAPRPARRSMPAWAILLLIAVIIIGVASRAIVSVFNFRAANSAGLTAQAGTAQVFGQTATVEARTVVALLTPFATVATSPTTQATATTAASPATGSPTQAIGGGVPSDASPVTPALVVGLPTSQPSAATVRPTALPTARPLAPTALPTRTPLPPSVVPLPPEAACQGPLAGGFGALWRSNATVAAALGCPTIAETPAQASLQYFEGGMMFWWQPTDRIYVLYGGGAGGWDGYANPNDPAYNQPREAAPAGFIEPIRGFGTLWHTVPPIRDALGWGTSPEYPLTGVLQPFPNGLMFYAPTLENRDARIWVLTNDGTWTRYRDPNS